MNDKVIKCFGLSFAVATVICPADAAATGAVAPKTGVRRPNPRAGLPYHPQDRLLNALAPTQIFVPCPPLGTEQYGRRDGLRP